jgi:cytochrome c oxidase subunit 4
LDISFYLYLFDLNLAGIVFMSATHTAHASFEDLAQVRKKYFWVFKLLIILTAIEIGAVFLKKLAMPVLLVDAIIVVFSCAKAVAVAYWYMHLEHETKWLKAVALLPLIAFCYAFVLIIDTKMSRPISVYMPEPERHYKISHHEDISELPSSMALEHVVAKLPPPVESSAHAMPVVPVHEGASPHPEAAAPAAAASDPAAEWR